MSGKDDYVESTNTNSLQLIEEGKIGGSHWEITGSEGSELGAVVDWVSTISLASVPSILLIPHGSSRKSPGVYLRVKTPKWDREWKENERWG